MLTEHPLVNAVIFALLGVAVFAVAYAILLKLTPLNLWRELSGRAQYSRGHLRRRGGHRHLPDHRRGHALSASLC